MVEVVFSATASTGVVGHRYFFEFTDAEYENTPLYRITAVGNIAAAYLKSVGKPYSLLNSALSAACAPTARMGLSCSTQPGSAGDTWLL